MKVTYLSQHPNRVGERVMLRDLEEGEVAWCATINKYLKKEAGYMKEKNRRGLMWYKAHRLTYLDENPGAYTLNGIIQ